MKTEAPPANPPSTPPAAPPQARTPLEIFTEALQVKPKDAPPQDAPPPVERVKLKSKPKSIAELTQLVELEADDIYALEVPSAQDGAAPYTVGKLKDLAANEDKHALRSVQLETDYRAKEAKLLAAETELHDILAALPANVVTPKLREHLANKRNAAAVTERQRVLDVIPEWRDAAVRSQELGAMVEFLKGNGFPESFLGSVIDHRMMRFIRGAWQMETMVKAVLEKVKERTPTTPPKSGKAPAPKANGKTRMQSPEERAIGSFEKTLGIN